MPLTEPGRVALDSVHRHGSSKVHGAVSVFVFACRTPFWFGCCYMARGPAVQACHKVRITSQGKVRRFVRFVLDTLKVCRGCGMPRESAQENGPCPCARGGAMQWLVITLRGSIVGRGVG